MLCAAQNLRALARTGIIAGIHIVCALCTLRIRDTAGLPAFACGRTVYMDLLQTAKLILVMAAGRYTALEFIHGFSFLSRCVFRVLRGRNYISPFSCIYTQQNISVLFVFYSYPPKTRMNA